MITIAIILNNIKEEDSVQIRFTDNEDKYLLKTLKNIRKDGTEFYSKANIWDCAGDIALSVYMSESTNKEEHCGDKRIILHLPSAKKIESRYYTSETLIMVFSKIDNWKIILNYEEKIKMTKEKFLVECPAFDAAVIKGGVNALSKSVKRGYAHPMDSGIVKFLDNKMINSVFKNMIEMVADSTYGPVVASGIPVNDKNYPEINTLLEECVAELGIKRPYTVISSAISGLNAMTFGSDEEPYIALSPLLVQTFSKEQLKFVIGHECGHIAMGHVVYHAVVNVLTNFATAVPVIGPIIKNFGALPLMAWSRRSEISADRAGLLCCGDGEVAKRALLQLAMPFMDTSVIDLDDYVQNAEKYLNKGFMRKISEFNDAHPIIPKRIHALKEFENSIKYYTLSNKPVVVDAISDSQLEMRIEEIIRIM